MQEILALVLEQARNVWRFRWWALVIAWVIAIFGWVYVYSLPNQYRSEARVHIDTTSAIHPLLNGMAVTPNIDQQVDLLIQTVLSRPNLKDIARQTGLDLNVTNSEQEQSLLDGLHSRISLRRSGGKTDLYRIGYTSGSPKTAQAVVQEVINIMTRMAVGDNQNGDSKQATKFLSKEVDKYRQRLNQTEHELATFKKQHAELMPGKDDYSAQVRSANASISNMQDELAVARDRKASLQQQLSGKGSGGTSPAQSRQIQSIDQQLAQSQNKLQQLLAKYTPQHPDVIAEKNDIARLKQQRTQTLARLRANPSAIEPVTGPDGTSGLSSELDSVNTKIRTLQYSIQRQQSQLSKLKAGADDMTNAQGQLAELSRNYQVTEDQYQKLLTRLYSARLSTDVEQSNDPLKFRVIDPPEKPAQPTGPQRTILIALALVGAIGAGLAFAFFLSQIRPVFINRRSLTDVTGLPVLGSVTMAWSPGQRARRHTALLLFLLGAGTLLVGFVGAVLFAPIGVHLVPSFLTGQPL
ncbi:MAG: hypothetical protein PF501_17610 [Salinisphaera sp.]|jgi:polysaccharide chain length determinant protein (PEP-CTERM system associated)|nr:hypothetical protein [Salinisphaera sp.]